MAGLGDEKRGPRAYNLPLSFNEAERSLASVLWRSGPIGFVCSIDLQIVLDIISSFVSPLPDAIKALAPSVSDCERLKKGGASGEMVLPVFLPVGSQFVVVLWPHPN